VHPRVGTLDAAAVADVFLRALGDQSEGDRLMELQWRQEQVLRVERRAPLTTRSGKILHLHVATSAEQGPGRLRAPAP
jgi:hypothetical protein